MNDASDTLRIDKWLWQARFFKTRSLAAKVVQEGKVRIDGTRTSKPARAVKPGDTLTFAQGDATRVIRIVELGVRRGPAPEAQALYEDLAPPQPKPRERLYEDRIGGRPTKKDRRKLMGAKSNLLE